MSSLLDSYSSYLRERDRLSENTNVFDYAMQQITQSLVTARMGEIRRLRLPANSLSAGRFRDIQTICQQNGVQIYAENNPDYQELEFFQAVGRHPIGSNLVKPVPPTVAAVEKRLKLSSDLWDSLPAEEIVKAVFEVINDQMESKYYVRTPPQNNLCRETTLPENTNQDTYRDLTPRFRGI